MIKKNQLYNWLIKKYDGQNNYYDYCYSIYYEILDYCSKNNLEISIPEDVFLGHLISVIYETYQ